MKHQFHLSQPEQEKLANLFTMAQICLCHNQLFMFSQKLCISCNKILGETNGTDSMEDILSSCIAPKTHNKKRKQPMHICAKQMNEFFEYLSQAERILISANHIAGVAPLRELKMELIQLLAGDDINLIYDYVYESKDAPAQTC